MKKIFTASIRTIYYWAVFIGTFATGMWYNYTFGDPLDGIRWAGVDIFVSGVRGLSFARLAGVDQL